MYFISFRLLVLFGEQLSLALQGPQVCAPPPLDTAEIMIIYDACFTYIITKSHVANVINKNYFSHYSFFPEFNICDLHDVITLGQLLGRRCFYNEKGSM